MDSRHPLVMRSAAALAAVALTLVSASCRDRPLKPIAGQWFVDDAGPRKPAPHLYWVKDGRRIVVDRQIQAYASPGCIIYISTRPSASQAVFGVITGKTPVAVSSSDAFHPWHLRFDGLRRFDLPRTDEGGTTTLAVDFIAAYDVCSLAYQQPEFREDWAEKSGPLDAARIKVEHTVLDVHGADSVGNSTLSDEVSHRHPDVVDELLRAGADVNAPNISGGTPLTTAIAFEAEGTEIIQRLLDAGADKDFQDNRGMTPLMVAARYGRKAAVALLLARGADPTIHDNGGRTAAAMTGNSKADADMTALLENAAAAHRK